MATQTELPELKQRLLTKEVPAVAIEKYLSYLQAEIRAEATKDANKRPVTNNSIDNLENLFSKFYRQGLIIDGVNVVVTGKNMGMITYHGYKNKVLATYPETLFDIQVVREGDDFSVAKESGSVVYSHNVADPFGNAKIVGAYCVIKNKRGEYLELLNSTDYNSMQSASKQGSIWSKWPSEFWLKSVIKRACKRHFNDVVAEIDKMDNDDFGAIDSLDNPGIGAADDSELTAAIQEMEKQDNLDDLKSTYMGFAPRVRNNPTVFEAKQRLKDKLEAAAAVNGDTDD